MQSCYDLTVIGGGSAGLTAAAIAGRVGAQVLLVDKEALGGDCLFHGCVPSKSLIHCAKVAHTARGAARFGVHAGEVDVDFGQVMDYVQSTIAAVGVHDSPEHMREQGVDVAFGGARFLSPTLLEINGRQLESKRAIIATGSRAFPPPIPGLEEVGYLDHISLFEQRELPRRLVVIGGGPIGLEMGQALARLGSQVTVLQRSDRVLPRDDAELVLRLQTYLADELSLLLDTDVVSVARSGDGKLVEYEREGKRQSIECDEVLVAVGRKPTLAGLGLDHAKVEHNEQGIVVDASLRTSASNIWACGDCVGSYQFTHFAEAQARVAARNALFLGSTKFDGSTVPWTTFTDPEVAHVGLTEAEAEAQGLNADVYRFDYGGLDRAICDGAERGLGKIVCDRKGRILGASLLGSRAGEALAEVVLAMQEGLTLSQVAKAIHVYPTMNRIVRRLGDERFFDKGVSKLTTKLFGQFDNYCLEPNDEADR